MIIQAHRGADVKIYSAAVQLYRVKHLFELGPVQDDGQYAGVPEVLYLGHYVTFTRDWQRYGVMINNLDPDHPNADALKVSRVLTSGDRFLCDFHPGHNYISGDDADLPDPKAKCLIARGNVVTGIEGKLNSGIPVLYVTVLDATKPPDFSIRERWLNPEATNIVFASQHVNPFDTLGGRNTGIPLRYPLMGIPSMRPYIRMSELEKLPLGSVPPSPYVPPM